MPDSSRRAGLRALAPVIAPMMALAVSACATTRATPGEVAVMDAAMQASALPAPREERDAIARQDLLSQAKFWTAEFDKSPSDHEAALKLAQALRQIGSSARAEEVASQALTFAPEDIELTLVLAQAALDQGKPEAAVTPLARAEAAGQGDWRMQSVIGVVMDSMGRHSDAQGYYAKALAISPENPKVLSNLALSLVLQGKPDEAEGVLRTALDQPGADDRVRQNLVLVLGVQGKFADAEAAAGETVPRTLLESNRDYFQALLTPSRSWDTLRGAQK
jgi:Flp pilus assembly protein TadD